MYHPAIPADLAFDRLLGSRFRGGIGCPTPIRDRAGPGRQICRALAGRFPTVASSRPAHSRYVRTSALSLHSGQHRGIGPPHGPMPEANYRPCPLLPAQRRLRGLGTDRPVVERGGHSGRAGILGSRRRRGETVWCHDFRACGLVCAGRRAPLQRRHNRFPRPCGRECRTQYPSGPGERRGG